MSMTTPTTIEAAPVAGTYWTHPDTPRRYELRPDPDWFAPEEYEWHNGELVHTGPPAPVLGKGFKRPAQRPLVLFEVWPSGSAERSLLGWGPDDFARAGWRRHG